MSYPPTLINYGGHRRHRRCLHGTFYNINDDFNLKVALNMIASSKFNELIHASDIMHAGSMCNIGMKLGVVDSLG